MKLGFVIKVTIKNLQSSSITLSVVEE